MMKWLNLITLALTIMGGLNWGLVALGGHESDFVASLFGTETSAGARLAYGLVALSALWQVLPWAKSLSVGESEAEAGRRIARISH